MIVKTQEQIEQLARLRSVGLLISRGVKRALERKRGQAKRNRRGGASLMELWSKRRQTSKGGQSV